MVENEQSIDQTKGLMICLVVFGHNTLLTRFFPEANRLIYGFHVFSFLLLPFLVSWPVCRPRKLLDHAVRYLYPYVVFFLVYSSLFVLALGSSVSIDRWIVAFFSGSADRLDSVTGFQLLWFLPTFFALYVIRFFYVSSGFSRVYLFVFCLLHFFVGLLEKDLKDWGGFGFLIAGYIFPLGVFLQGFVRRFGRHGYYGPVVLFFALASGFFYQLLGLKVNLARLEVYSVFEFGSLVVTDLLASSALLFFVWLFGFFQVKSLRILGVGSLVVYLFHSLFYQSVLLVLRRFGYLVGVGGDWLIGSLIFFVSLIVCLALVNFFNFSGQLRRIFFPRDLFEVVFLRKIKF